MFESRYSKVLTIILIIVIIAIVALLGFLAFDYVKKYSTTKQASDFVDNYQGDINTGDNSNSVVEENVTLDGANEISTNMGTTKKGTKKKFKGYTVVGTMKIPTINLEYPILEEVGAGALETGLVVFYPSPDNINLPGNTVVAGHNYRNGLFFSNVKKLANGDKIYVTDYRGTSVTYEVYNKFEASSTDTSFYSRNTDNKPELTLSTCTDASNDQRTIVFAKQI